MKKYLLAVPVILLGIILLNLPGIDGQSKVRATEEVVQRNQEVKLYIGSSEWVGQVLSEGERYALIQAFTIEEQEIYTFLQGPRAWEEGVSWSGEWCQMGVKGNSFGNFGCGLCCMANIYDTLSSHKISPWDMCEYAMNVSGYAPRKNAGAIDWGNMKEVLKRCGMTCDVYNKPDSYEKFQEQMAHVKTAIVLVSSDADDTYWKDTPGHYVNIWLYEDESDTVFLAEPGSPDNNRTRIPLKYVYDALKTTSKFQYLAVDEYKEENNLWKTDGIDEKWNQP